MRKVIITPSQQAELNERLVKCQRMLREIGVPISESICPFIRLAASHSFYGQCCPKSSRFNDTGYDYLIRISVYTLNNSEKSLMNTMIHELLHTVPRGHGHKGEWLRWARYVNKNLGYNICRIGGDKTGADKQNLLAGMRETKIRYIIKCPSCGITWKRSKYSKFVERANEYRCGKCHTYLERIK